MRRACFVWGMLAMAVGCGSSGSPGEPEPLGAAAEALTGDEPDLVISSVSAPPSAVPGSYFATSVTVCNEGNSASYSTDVEVKLSDDDIITPSDLTVGYAPLGYLDRGRCVELGVQTTAAVPDGAYTLGVVVDRLDHVIELSETNNSALTGEIGIGYGPDLVVSAVSGPPSAFPGGGFEVQVTVCNQGTTPSHTPFVEVLLSPDATIEPWDHLLGGAPLPWLDAGQCGSVTVPVSANVPEGAYSLGAIAHENGWNDELVTSNNARAGELLGVGYQADLVVSAVSGPPSAMPGGILDASVTVCNQGTQPSYGAEVDLLLSADGEITPADFPIGDGYVPFLSPGECFSATIPANTYVPDGAYTLGAIVDASDVIIELIETNNAAAGGVIGVGHQPDLIVSSVSGPPSAMPGGILNASVTVCNQGTQASYGSYVDLYLSSDAVITGADVPIGGDSLPYLEPGQCETRTFQASVTAPDGAYHLGAIVDRYNGVPELVETNNAAAGPVIGVGYRPDLVVSAVSGPPSALPGSGFGATVTVCNQGTTPSYSAALELRLSPDDSITWTDTPAGGAPAPYLDPGQCAAVTIPASAYVPDGTYHLGAIVDPYDWQPELIETNNATAGDLIGVGYLPDLIVSSVSGPPSVTPGSGFTGAVTICNQGTTPSYGVDVELFLSADGAITRSDIHAGNFYVPSLSPGQCASVDVPASAYAPDGAYRLGAIVDPNGWFAELIETNNAAAGSVIGVGYAPDLVVSAVSGPPSVYPGGGFDAEITVCNQGTNPSYGTHVELRLSADANISTADFLAGGGPVPYLDPGQCATVTFAASAYVPDGAYHLGAIVDPYTWQPELIETNNAGSGSLLGVGYWPDLIVSSVSGPPSVLPGSGFNAAVTVCNQGTTPTYGADVELFLSSDGAITPSDVHAGNAYVPGLNPGQCASIAVPASAYVPDGAHHLGAIVDPNGALDELIETNNAAAGGVIGVGYAPDLVVSSVSGPPSVIPGGGFDVSVTVCNQGTQTSYGTQVELLLSADATLTMTDSPAGNAPVPYLDPGQCATVTFPASAYVPDGAYHLGAIVDRYGWVPELIETNNAEASAVIGVGYWPDLIVSAVSGPPSVLPGSGFDASVTVCNQGTQPSYGAAVELYLSADATLTAGDTPVGSGMVSFLAPGQCATVPVPAYLYAPDGAYRLGAIVDRYDWQKELNESNNAAPGDLIGVGVRPDLVVSSISGPPSALPGSGFDVSVTVCNQGTTPSYGVGVDLLLSSDDAITPSDAHAGSGYVPGLSPGQCTSVLVPASAYVPDGAHRLGAIVDPGGSLDELIESNNAAAGSVIGVGFRPDFIVSAVSGPPSLAPGDSFDAEVTVCNQGTQPGYGSNVELRLSSDATVTTADFLAGNGSVPYLAPGQCATVTFPASAYVPEGAYHLGAIVDAYGWIPELIETNNVAAGELMAIGHGPDLVVSTVSGPPSATPGSVFDASITVCNQGTAPSYGTLVEVRLSADATITTADFLAGGAWVPKLDVGQCESLLIPADVDVPADSYTLGAIVDAYGNVTELLEGNNATAGGELLVSF
ncbi:CARDB domain-containing protein [Sorangium sp. So ce1000]|uniref:CARDB domain-containing protein n=1 Tax=Sorangium sp. So ce1000 TaxID=3133325 RepID=UPI003F63C22E